MTKEGKITVKDLTQEYDLDGRIIRQFARTLGLNAPETGLEGFGPKKRYEWEADSEDLKKLRNKIESYLDDTFDTEAPEAEEAKSESAS